MSKYNTLTNDTLNLESAAKTIGASLDKGLFSLGNTTFSVDGMFSYGKRIPIPTEVYQSYVYGLQGLHDWLVAEAEANNKKLDAVNELLSK